jgi:imidazolonepropionase-like amidohydrolase
MDRRQFLSLSALMAASTSVATVSCSNVSNRYVKPQALTLPHEKLLLTNARIVDVERGELMRQSRLLIVNGKIEGLFADTDETVASDRQLDIGGAYVIPGIINAHCHLTLPGGVSLGPSMLFSYARQVERNAEECVRHGVTTVRDMLSIFNGVTNLRDKMARGDIVGPRIVSCCAMDIEGSYGDAMAYDKQARYWQLITGPQQAREAVKEAIDLGADFIKIFQQRVQLLIPPRPLELMDLATVAAIVDEANKHGKVVAMHQSEKFGLEKALKAGVPSIEHVVRDRDLDDESLRAAVESDAISVPTVSAPFGLAHQKPGDKNWGQRILPELVALRAKILPAMLTEFCEPKLAEGSLEMFAKYSDPSSYESWHLVPWPDAANFTAAVVYGIQNARRLYDAGMTFGCGNDGGVPFAFPGLMGLEMHILERAGMKPADILKMATANNARLLRLDNEIGTIEVGKVADLAVFDENPLDSMFNLFFPRMVFQQGQPTYQANGPVRRIEDIING